VKLGFEAVQGGEDTQANAPRISKNQTTPFGLSPQYIRQPGPPLPGRQNVVDWIGGIWLPLRQEAIHE